jgi:hypothetical protein
MQRPHKNATNLIENWKANLRLKTRVKPLFSAWRNAMGAAIIKAVGIYRPGSFVKLASGQVGMVIRRGGKSTNPAVVVVLNRNGVPVFADAIRETTDAKYAVVSGVPSSSIKVTLNLEKILSLSKH